MKDPGSYANPVNSSFQKFRTTRTLAMVDQGHNRGGQTWSPAAHLQGPSQAALFDIGGAMPVPVPARQVLPGFGDRRPGRTPALFLKL